MGLFGKFLRSRKSKAQSKAETSAASTGKNGCSNSNKKTSMKDGSVSGRTLDTSSENSSSSSRSAHANATIVKTFLERLNAHDRKALREMVTEDLVMEWTDQQLQFGDYIEAVEGVWRSFPDFTLSWKSVEQDQNGIVTVHECIPRGTHTGEPFGFGPYEPVEATGKKVENAAETITVTIHNGKICKWFVRVNGDMTGPAGMYAQLGGFPCM